MVGFSMLIFIGTASTVGSHAYGERATSALRIAGTDKVGFSLSGRVLSLSLSISRDIVVASIPYMTKAEERHGTDTVTLGSRESD